MQIFCSKHNSNHMTQGYYQHLVGYVYSCVLYFFYLKKSKVTKYKIWPFSTTKNMMNIYVPQNDQLEGLGV